MRRAVPGAVRKRAQRAAAVSASRRTIVSVARERTLFASLARTLVLALQPELEGLIVSERKPKQSIVSDAELWASCVGGAAQQGAYR